MCRHNQAMRHQFDCLRANYWELKLPKPDTAKLTSIDHAPFQRSFAHSLLPSILSFACAARTTLLLAIEDFKTKSLGLLQAGSRRRECITAQRKADVVQKLSVPSTQVTQLPPTVMPLRSMRTATVPSRLRHCPCPAL
jgi:hypothetical protein